MGHLLNAIARLVVSIASVFAPRQLRDRWLEEWRAELAAASRISGGRALRLALGAPLDAASSRWTTRDAEPHRGTAWRTDLKQTARALAKAPGHVLTVSLCLGVGIAVCTTTFSILNTFMNGERPGIEDRARLPRLYVYGNGDHAPATIQEFEVLAAKAPGVNALAAERRADFSIRVPGHQAMHAAGAFVNGEYFRALGTKPIMGRLLAETDDSANAPLAVVLSHAFWTARIGAPADIVGRTIVLGDREALVAGVAPEGFTGLASDDFGGGGYKIYVPLAHAKGWPGAPAPDRFWMDVAARVERGSDLSALSVAMQPLAARIQAMSPESRKDARIVLEARGLAPGTGVTETMAMVILMMAAPLTVLAIGCANVANLQLVRASLRARELAVRASLGASRGQIVRLLTLEAAMLAIGGFAAAAVLINVLLRIATLVFPVPIAIDFRVLLFCLGIALLVIGATGVLPARAATRAHTADALRAGGRSIAAGNSKLRRGLVVAQVSLCFLLLLTAAMFTRGMIALAGTMPPHLATTTATEIRFDVRNYPAAERRRVLDEFEARMRADTRVENVALTSVRPLGGQESRFWLQGDAPDLERFEFSNAVTGTYFDTASIRLLRGRTFTPGEKDAVIVNDTFVTRYRLAEPVLGTALRLESGMATIVGVVETTRERPLMIGPRATIYMPMQADAPPNYVGVWIRTPHAREMAGAARTTLSQIDPDLPALAVRTLEDYFTEEAAPLTQIARAAGGLGSVALLLAVSGLYSVIAFFVALRTNEFGIRMALGARASDIVRMVIAQAGRLVGIGLGVGVLFGVPLLIGLHTFMPFTSMFDPVVLVPTIVTLAMTGLLAAWLPARRASSIEASIALRAE